MIMIDTTAQPKPLRRDSELIISDEEESKRESNDDKSVPKDPI